MDEMTMPVLRGASAAKGGHGPPPEPVPGLICADPPLTGHDGFAKGHAVDCIFLRRVAMAQPTLRLTGVSSLLIRSSANAGFLALTGPDSI